MTTEMSSVPTCLVYYISEALRLMYYYLQKNINDTRSRYLLFGLG